MVVVGIDVGSKDGVVVTRHNSKSGQATRLDNTAEGHPSLLAHGKKHSEPMCICLEAMSRHAASCWVRCHGPPS